MNPSRTLRTAVFGGTFDPIHDGHLSLAREILDHGLSDEVFFVPAGKPPHKSDRKISSGKVRTEMLMKAIANEPRFAVSDYELENDYRTSYTISTLRAFTAAMPGRRFSLMLGMDNFIEFDSWHQYEHILRDYPLIVFSRPGHRKAVRNFVMDKLPPTYGSSLSRVGLPDGGILRLFEQRGFQLALSAFLSQHAQVVSPAYDLSIVVDRARAFVLRNADRCRDIHVDELRQSFIKAACERRKGDAFELLRPLCSEDWSTLRDKVANFIDSLETQLRPEFSQMVESAAARQQVDELQKLLLPLLGQEYFKTRISQFFNALQDCTLITFVDSVNLDHSSTEIRRLAAAGQDVAGLTQPAVAEYIAQNKLYQN